MNGKYVGYVAGDDPLHDFLGKIIRDVMDVREPRLAFRAFRLSGSNVVYAYEEKFSGTKIFCKFYGPRFAPDWDMAAWKARQEYERLETLRRYNLIGSPHHVIRPLGFHRDINGVLATEYYAGEEFSQAIARATCHRDDAHLFWRLKALAYFLATQHDRTAIGVGVDFDADCEYFDTVAGGLARPTASGRATSTNSPLCATAGGTRSRCGRTSRSGCTAMRLRRTSCLATAWTSRRSTWNA